MYYCHMDAFIYLYVNCQFFKQSSKGGQFLNLFTFIYMVIKMAYSMQNITFYFLLKVRVCYLFIYFWLNYKLHFKSIY